MSTITNVPFQLAQTSIEPGVNSISLLNLELKIGQVAELRWWQLNYIKTITAPNPDRVNTSLPLVFLGLYYSSAGVSQRHSGEPLCWLGLDVPGIAASPSNFKINLTSSGYYSVLAVNNSANATISLSALGALQVTGR